MKRISKGVKGEQKTGIDARAGDYTNLCRLLDGYWEKPWSKLPNRQKQAWHEALGIISGDKDSDGKLWEARDANERQFIVKQHDAKYDPVFEGQRLVAHYDVSLHAAIWWTRTNVKPDEAAMLLCRIDPLSDKDPENTYVDDDRRSPDRYRVLRRVFEDEAETALQSRMLLDWLCVAQRQAVPYHQWIDEYANALYDAGTIATEAPPAPRVDAGEANASGEGAKPNSREGSKPLASLPVWEVQHQDDPEPLQPWYTPSRYFARVLIKEDVSLINKRGSPSHPGALPKKVVEKLTEIGTLKRGGKKSLSPVTILKSFAGVDLCKPI